jgi:hypothetical protein
MREKLNPTYKRKGDSVTANVLNTTHGGHKEVTHIPFFKCRKKNTVNPES